MLRKKFKEIFIRNFEQYLLVSVERGGFGAVEGVLGQKKQFGCRHVYTW
jgi:hypothetical protein